MDQLSSMSKGVKPYDNFPKFCFIKVGKKLEGMGGLKLEPLDSLSKHSTSVLILLRYPGSLFGLIHACGAAATCVWPAYGLRPSHFDCLMSGMV